MRGAKLTPRKLTSEEEHEIRDRLRLLSTVGKQVEGTSQTNDITTKPNYYDELRVAPAQGAVNNYYASISMSSGVGLLLLAQLKEILIPLLKTGRSRTVVDLYTRYSATIKYIKRCYETNIFDSTSDGWRYINIVRSMHQRTHSLMNSPECREELRKPDSEYVGDEYVWVNQYDMALTQFAFIGLFLLRPDKCGAYHVSELDMSNIVYYWRLLSYQLGIEDRFNLFVYSHDMSKQIRLLELILDEFKQKLVTPRDETGLAMARGIMLALEDLVTETTFNILEHHWFEVVSLTGNDKLAPYDGMGERWKLFRFRLIFGYLVKSELALKWVNRMYKRKSEKFCDDSTRIRKKLAKKYPDQVYQLDDHHTIPKATKH
uniref:Uncharacterized protein n=1 Tax=Aceria tosichella TaxID=561515 RepID=A0A6G1S9E9_9ACAR